MRLLVSLGLALSVSACATWETSSLPSETKKAEVPATISLSDIIVSETALPGRSYDRLGPLKVTVNKTTALHPAPTREAVIAKLREDAAKLGGNAVIEATISETQISAFSWGTRTGTGTAVRLKD